MKKKKPRKYQKKIIIDENVPSQISKKLKELTLATLIPKSDRNGGVSDRTVSLKYGKGHYIYTKDKTFHEDMASESGIKGVILQTGVSKKTINQYINDTLPDFFSSNEAKTIEGKYITLSPNKPPVIEKLKDKQKRPKKKH